MNFTQKIATYTLGLITEKDLPDVAMTGLEEGYDAESLRILAGYRSSDNGFQIAEYFRKSLAEIGLSQESQKNSLINVIKYYAVKIINSQLDAYDGFEEIDKIVRRTAVDYQEISLMDCYTDYISIWEVKNDGLQLHTGPGLTKEQYISKIKQDMISALQVWLMEVDNL